MNKIGERIKYLPATNDPLSADVFCIDGDQYCYVYDVGSNERSLRYINQIFKEKVVVLSHHHKDHTGNIDGVHYSDLFVGRKTYEAIGKGVIVEDASTKKRLTTQVSLRYKLFTFSCKSALRPPIPRPVLSSYSCATPMQAAASLFGPGGNRQLGLS